jgi:hypothetical protein
MTRTLSYTEELTVTTCWCGMAHAIPTTLYNFVHRKHDEENVEQWVYCPLGHKWTPAGKSKLTTTRERLNETSAELIAMRDQLDAANRESARLAKRAANGVCPCCGRSFVQLARHMKVKHPTYSEAPS